MLGALSCGSLMAMALTIGSPATCLRAARSPDALFMLENPLAKLFPGPKKQGGPLTTGMDQILVRTKIVNLPSRSYLGSSF